MVEKIPMTAEGHRKLEEELKRLKNKERPAVVQAISEARDHGDLSENAEYHAAKDRQGLIEARIAELEGKVSRAQVIDPKKISGSSVKFGATVTLIDVDTDEEVTYQLVGDDEADARNGRISISSPIARALIGKEQGDEIDVATPGGGRGFEILKVSYK